MAEPWPQIPSEGFVMVLPGSPVYLQPHAASPFARLGWPTAEPPPWPAGGTVVRATGMHDGFVEIAPLHHPYSSHCEHVLDGEEFDVRLYVSPWSLGAVTTRTVTREYEDGTSITVGPGAPLRALPEQGRWAVSVDDVRLSVELPEDAVGMAYPDVEPFALGGMIWDGTGGQPWLSYDEGQRLWLVSRFGSSEATIVDTGPWGSGVRVRLAGSCVKATVFSDREPVHQGHDDFVHFDFGLGAPVVGPVPPGAAALDVDDLLQPPPEAVDEIVPEAISEQALLRALADSEFGFDEDVLEGELLNPALLDAMSFGSDNTQVFEAGAPIYLSAGGPAAGELRSMLPMRDGWVMGDRVCFATSFGVSFQPMLPVCFDGAEGRLQTPETLAHDSSMAVVTPGEVTTTGAFEPGAVERALRRHRHHLRRCFDESKTTGLPAPDRVELTVALAVEGDGTIAGVELRAGLRGHAAHCAMESAKTWQMPAPSDGEPGQVVFAVTVGHER